jgi:hypothetical protein
MSEEATVALLTEIRNWIRAASYTSIKSLLEKALPDAQSRVAYQMLDGTASIEEVRTASKMSPNKLIALTQKWTSMGIMELGAEKKRKRLFDLRDFGLFAIED